MLRGLRVLAQDPVSVFAHDCQSMEHHRLAAREDRSRLTTVELRVSSK